MGIALIKIKIMPKSPDTDLKKIEKKAKLIIIKEKGQQIKFEKEPVAFGLYSLIITLSREETLDSDNMMDKLQKINSVSSAEIIDFRRAIA